VIERIKYQDKYFKNYIYTKLNHEKIWVYRLNHADLALTYPEAFAEQRFQPKMCSC
jgi:hypothetical protein